MREDADFDVRTEQVSAAPAAQLEVEQLRRQVAELTKATMELQLELKRQPPAPVVHPPSYRTSSVRRCWLCEEQGHLQAQCPLKARLLQLKNQGN